jgi:hypothetical protein
VSAHIISALLDTVDDVRVMLANKTIQKNRRRQFELVEHLEHAPDANPETVVSPREITLRLVGGRPSVWVASEPGHEREMLDIQSNIKRQPLPFRPFVIRPSFD